MAATARAFPPAPSYTLYGIVRDQIGQTLAAEGAELILLKGGVEIGRTPIHSGLQLDQNYELQIRLDQNRSGTTIYSDKAVATEGLFSLVVAMNGSLFYPIEVKNTWPAPLPETPPSVSSCRSSRSCRRACVSSSMRSPARPTRSRAARMG